MRKFRKVARYKFHIQKLTAFLYTRNNPKLKF